MAALFVWFVPSEPVSVISMSLSVCSSPITVVVCYALFSLSSLVIFCLLRNAYTEISCLGIYTVCGV